MFLLALANHSRMWQQHNAYNQSDTGLYLVCTHLSYLLCRSSSSWGKMDMQVSSFQSGLKVFQILDVQFIHLLLRITVNSCTVVVDDIVLLIV